MILPDNDFHFSTTKDESYGTALDITVLISKYFVLVIILTIIIQYVFNNFLGRKLRIES
jgi:hypothetical protein